MIEELSLPIADPAGRACGMLHISCLAGRTQWNDIAVLVDRRGEPETSRTAAPVQLLEEMSYGYDFEVADDSSIVEIQPAELFTFTRNRAHGRFEAKRATGTVTIDVMFSSGVRATCELEVRSRKIDYQTDYRSMLCRIAREAAELVQSSFAASSLRGFRPDMEADPETLYQRFAFMQSLLSSDEVQDALHLIERRPHHEHVESISFIDPGRAARSNRLLVRELTAAGPRQPSARPIAGLNAVPMRVRERVHITTYDTIPNRFVKYVLTHWRNVAVDVARRLGSRSHAEQRGQREATSSAELLERALATPALQEAGRLNAFPQSNQVLQGRAGYRDVLEAFLLAEAAATIDWGDHDRLFSAGQRDVADLYEHWVFLELVRIVECLPGFAVDRRPLVRRSDNGLTLDLRRTGNSVVHATGHRRGRPVEVQVWFNKSFHRSHHGADSSWSETMRPDCSIRIAPAGGTLGADTWVHFDAKYRVRSADLGSGPDADLAFSEESQITDEVSRSGVDRPISGDLVKMHAYRDAIRRTAGAYVLYPGGDGANRVDHRQYHEILPGLGAFVLRPTESGQASASSSSALQSFLEEVIDHVAAQGTASERARYWTDQSYREAEAVRLELEPALNRPAKDTAVLLGFIRSRDHLEWCLRNGLYNLRADQDRRGAVGLSSPELGVDFVVLYDAQSDETWTFSATGAFYVRTASELLDSGYPEPGGRQYVCLEIHPQPLASMIGAAHVRGLARVGRPAHDFGAPRVVTWDQLIRSVD